MSRFGDQVGNAPQLIFRETRAFAAEQRFDHLLRGAIEEGVDEMPERRLADGAARDDGQGVPIDEETWREITLAARGLNVLIETPQKSA